MAQRYGTMISESINDSGHYRDGGGSLASGSKFPDVRSCHKENDTSEASDFSVASLGKSSTCHICEKTYSSSSVLRKHLLVHSNAKPYTCQECGKSFGRKGVLKRHLVTHSNEKPYHCELCGKGFTQKGSVVKHMVVHTGEKPYQCHKCLGSFTEKSNLLKHLRVVHKDKERYKCSKCEKRFAFKCQLTEHTNEVHATYHKTFSAVPSVQCCCTPLSKNSEQRHFRNTSNPKITTIGIPLTYPPAPLHNGDQSISLKVQSYFRKSSDTRRIREQDEGPSQTFSIPDLPKRSSVFVPLVLYKDDDTLE